MTTTSDIKICKDCLAERKAEIRIEHPLWTERQVKDLAEFSIRGRRAAPNPGPRCATHWRAERRRKSAQSRMRRVRSQYGLTDAEHDELLEIQGGACAGCSRTSAKNLHVDHDHSCCAGKTSCGRCVRGLLCNDCNQTLARFRDNPDTLRTLADYLENWPSFKLQVRDPSYPDEGYETELAQMEAGVPQSEILAPVLPFEEHTRQFRPDRESLRGDGMVEQCYRPGCQEFVTGSSDYCSEECERLYMYPKGTLVGRNDSYPESKPAFMVAPDPDDLYEPDTGPGALRGRQVEALEWSSDDEVH